MSAKLVPSLDIVIVNWNAGEHLRKCLESITKTDKKDYELNHVVIVDNDSSDRSTDGLEDILLPILLIRNPCNRGFAAACNQGAEHCFSDYLLFLNPDTELHDTSITKSIAFMDNPTNQHVGICGIQLIDGHGATTVSCARFPTLKIFFGKMSGLNRFFPKTFPAHHMTSSELQSSREVDQIIGAFFLVRRKVFDNLRGFDQTFFVYFEEVDFSLRAKTKGYTSYYLADARAFHEGCVSSDQIKSTRLFYSLRSRLQYASKHFTRVEFICLVILTFTLELVSRLIKVICHASWSHLIELMCGYIKLIKHYSKVICRYENS